MDRIAAELAREGITAVPQDLLRDGHVGSLFVVGRAEICYRIDDDDRTVVISHYKRRDGRDGLRHGFREFIWFLEFLCRERLRLRRVKGLIRAETEPGAMPTPRIAEMYKRVLGGSTLEIDHGEEWIYLDLADYRTMRERRRSGRSARHG